MNRAFKGVWIPKEIWCNKELNITERCFLTEIDSLDNDDGCFASNNYFADFFGLSKSRCSEIINKLEEKGLIKITYEYKENSKAVEKRIIKVVGFSSRCIRDSEQDGIRDSEEGVFGKPKDNNISINNKNNNNSATVNNEVAERIWSLYPVKKGKATSIKKIPNIIKEIGEEQLIRCIERYKAEFKNNDYTFMKHGSTFFNGAYIDYIDENYQGGKNIEKKNNSSFNANTNQKESINHNQGYGF